MGTVVYNSRFRDLTHLRRPRGGPTRYRLGRRLVGSLDEPFEWSAHPESDMASTSASSIARNR
jgi:hypothetical protein